MLQKSPNLLFGNAISSTLVTCSLRHFTSAHLRLGGKCRRLRRRRGAWRCDVPKVQHNGRQLAQAAVSVSRVLAGQLQNHHAERVPHVCHLPSMCNMSTWHADRKGFSSRQMKAFPLHMWPSKHRWAAIGGIPAGRSMDSIWYGTSSNSSSAVHLEFYAQLGPAGQAQCLGDAAAWPRQHCVVLKQVHRRLACT